MLGNVKKCSCKVWVTAGAETSLEGGENMDINELCFAGTVEEIVYKNNYTNKFIIKSKDDGLKLLCNAQPDAGMDLRDIKPGINVYVQGVINLRTWINKAGNKVFENEFKITNLY